MTTTEQKQDRTEYSPEQHRDQIEYFLENFTREGLRYAKYEILRKIDGFKDELIRLEQESRQIKSRTEWLKSGIENYTLEYHHIASAMNEKSVDNSEK